MKRKVAGLLTVLLCTTLLTSCKPPLWFIKDDTGSSNYKDRQQLVFTHLWQRGSANYTDVNNMIKKFNESNIAKELNVFVKGDGINFWDYWSKVDLAISGGSSPDIFIHAVSSAPTRLNQMLNLTKMYQDDIANERESLDANEMFFPSQINDIAKYSSNGTDMHAWPFSSTVRVIYYNKDMFEEAGITETPKTWAELDEASRKLTKYNVEGDVSSGYAQIGFDPYTAEGQYMHQWGWLTGHNFWSTNPTNNRPVPNFNDPTLVKNLEKLYTSYVRRDEQARDNLQEFMAKNSANGQNPFVTKKMAMIIQNEGLYTTLKEAKVDFEYGVFEIPPMDTSHEYTNWSSSYSIELYDNTNRKVSKEVAEQRNRGAWEFLKFMYQEEFQGVIAKAGFMLSNRKYYDKFVYNDPILTDLTEAIAHTREAEFIKAAPNWTSDIQVYINNIYSKVMTVEEAMNSCQSLMNSKIEQYYSVNKN